MLSDFGAQAPWGPLAIARSFERSIPEIGLDQALAYFGRLGHGPCDVPGRSVAQLFTRGARRRVSSTEAYLWLAREAERSNESVHGLARLLRLGLDGDLPLAGLVFRRRFRSRFLTALLNP